jgi:DNA-binding NarL/FixJ family response regulator
MRERDILQLLVESLKDVDIARRLSLSPKTVRNYVSNILSNLQVTDRTEAATRALAAGVSTNRKAPDEHR